VKSEVWSLGIVRGPHASRDNGREAQRAGRREAVGGGRFVVGGRRFAGGGDARPVCGVSPTVNLPRAVRKQAQSAQSKVIVRSNFVMDIDRVTLVLSTSSDTNCGA
jgi:hypothetical protein